METSLKKLLSLTLAAIMVLSMFPAVYAAQEQASAETYAYDALTEVSTLEALKTALAGQSGQTVCVRLTEDITVTGENAAITEGVLLTAGDVILDLNGHTLTVEEAVILDGLFGTCGSAFTVTNGIIAQCGSYGSASACVAFSGNVSVTLDGVKWTLTDDSVRQAAGGMFALGAGQTLTVLNSQLTFDCGQTGSVTKGGLICTSDTATVTLKDSSFTGGRVVNKTEADGGVIYLAGKTGFSAENCTFAGGEAGRCGGLIFKANGKLDTNDPINAWDGSVTPDVEASPDKVITFLNNPSPSS